MDQNDFFKDIQRDLSLDLLLQETLALTEYLRANQSFSGDETSQPVQPSFFDDDTDYLLDLADSLIDEPVVAPSTPAVIEDVFQQNYPVTPGVIYKIDNGPSTFCVRGFSTVNIKDSFSELKDFSSSKRPILKMSPEDSSDSILFFETGSFELAEAIREQVINRRFPHQEDAVCNISDPGFSWWLDASEIDENGFRRGRFEIFFRSHGINRAEKYIQLGPIGDGNIAALRMNQARTLLRSSFPISEFYCDEKSFSVVSQKPDHSSFISFKNIFLEGINNTQVENFPDNSIGRTLFYYFHELAIVRKFWIEVKAKLG